VVALAAQGLSNQEIAKALWVSVDTVKSRLRKLFACTGVRDRAHLVTWAYQTGVLSRIDPR